MVDKLDDIYNVGTFCQVTEMRNVDDKLRLVLLGHRRIKITDIAKPAEPKKTGEKVEEEEKADVVDKIVQVNHNPLVASLFLRNSQFSSSVSNIFVNFQHYFRSFN